MARSPFLLPAFLLLISLALDIVRDFADQATHVVQSLSMRSMKIKKTATTHPGRACVGKSGIHAHAHPSPFLVVYEDRGPCVKSGLVESATERYGWLIYVAGKRVEGRIDII